jgi:predicted unusual protein kinase regulating ubiquinone biosynthesis (AarF/ABC1/UbiB family)
MAAETIYRFSFRSIYRLKAFNGDPHPGNYLFHGNGKVTFLDFGLVKLFGDSDLKLLTDIWKYALFEHNAERLRIAVEDAGFLMKNAPVETEELLEFMDVFVALVAKDEVLEVTSEYASEIARRVLFGRASHKEVVKYANIPPAYAILQRINLGLIALLGSLNASCNWRSISEEMWPEVNGDPKTALGELEHSWLASISN